MMIENTPTLITERFILRKFAKSDLKDILSLYGDDELNRFLPWYPIKTEAGAYDYLHDTILPQYDKTIAYSYAITRKAGGEVIGYLHMNDVGGANDIGYAVSRAYWHTGTATEVVGALIEHLKIVRFPFITATHDKDNPHSGGVMKKAGMEYKYSYIEQWQPKNISVTFRMYQLNLDGDTQRTYRGYWDKYPVHFIEEAPFD